MGGGSSSSCCLLGAVTGVPYCDEISPADEFSAGLVTDITTLVVLRDALELLREWRITSAKRGCGEAGGGGVPGFGTLRCRSPSTGLIDMQDLS